MTAFIEYKKTIAIATKIINTKKRAQFQNFCESINRFTGISYIWKVMSTYKNSRKNIEWNKWRRKNKEATIIKEIDKLAPPGVDSRMLDITKSQNNRNPELNDIQLR